MPTQENRRSKRLRGQDPEMDPTFVCGICIQEKEKLAPRLVQMPCCKNFLHARCQRKWQSEHATCCLCHGITPAPNMTSEQLVQRLRNFLTNDRLDSILEQVNSLTALQVLKHSLWVDGSELPGLIPVKTTYFW